MYKASLILEGGGMRGVYTAGVLDFFLDKNIEFDAVFGVSAGACTACSYLSKQRGRAYAVFTDYLNDDRYLSIKSLLKTGNAFGTEFIFDTIPNELNLYDYREFNKYNGRFYAVATDIVTGEAIYHPVTNLKANGDAAYVHASMSLPLISQTVEADGKKMLDGGIADSIPIQKAYDLGYRKNIVILTQCNGYRKKKTPIIPIIEANYHNYPGIIKAMNNRHLNYNNSLNLINLLKHTNECFVIQPKEPVNISRLEKNQDKLYDLYLKGYNDARESYHDLINYLNK